MLIASRLPDPDRQGRWQQISHTMRRFWLAQPPKLGPSSYPISTKRSELWELGLPNSSYVIIPPSKKPKSQSLNLQSRLSTLIQNFRTQVGQHIASNLHTICTHICVPVHVPNHYGSDSSVAPQTPNPKPQI